LIIIIFKSFANGGSHNHHMSCHSVNCSHNHHMSCHSVNCSHRVNNNNNNIEEYPSVYIYFCMQVDNFQQA